MSAEEFLVGIRPIEDKGNVSIRLENSLIEFLDEVARVKKSKRGTVAREIVLQAKAQWDQMTPAQRKGVAYE